VVAEGVERRRLEAQPIPLPPGFDKQFENAFGMVRQILVASSERQTRERYLGRTLTIWRSQVFGRKVEVVLGIEKLDSGSEVEKVKIHLFRDPGTGFTPDFELFFLIADPGVKESQTVVIGDSRANGREYYLAYFLTVCKALYAGISPSDIAKSLWSVKDKVGEKIRERPPKDWTERMAYSAQLHKSFCENLAVAQFASI